MRLLAAALLASALASPATPAAGAETQALLEGFRAGVVAYDKQDYDQAIAEWEKLLRFRVESAAVEYNLANAYFKKKDYGRAVLHWERALLMDPDDPETRANLDLARGFLVDDVATERPAALHLIDRIARVAGVDAITLVVFAALELLGLGVFLALLRGGRARRLGLAVAGMSFLVLLVAAPLLAFQVRAAEDRSRLVVLAPAVEARSGPGEQYTNVFTVHEGLVVRNRGSASGWEWIELPNGLNGWVPSESVERI